MPDLNPRVLLVSPSDPDTYKTISKAAERASEGDQIIVSPGTYALGKKKCEEEGEEKEKFPIYIPPRCQLIGSGVDTCFIDGGLDREIAQRPLNPYQSLVLLGDQAAISGFTIRNSGGNGISNEQGARVLITRNLIQDNAQHGILIFGTNGAFILENRFFNNGTAGSLFGGPREGIGKQGHHIYIEGRTDSTNEVSIINNIMEKVFADGIANDVYDQADGMSMRIRIVGNAISGCGRNGMSIVSSYALSRTEVFADIRNNKILQTAGNAIDLVTSYAIVNRSIHDAKLEANVIQNEIEQCGCGILAVGAYEASVNSKARYNIIQNNIKDATDIGIRVVGGYNLDDLEGWVVRNTMCNVVVANNMITDAGNTPLLVQGGKSEKAGKSDKPGVVNDNIVYAHIVGNEVIVGGQRKRPGEGLVMEDGEESNQVVLL